ncbi:MAG: ABC transporter ATP-binding protein [Nitrososphaerales archaeon]
MSQIQLGTHTNSSPAKTPILEVSNLVVKFTKTGLVGSGKEITTAVDGVSFELRESEITTIVGESGSGKTTVANCILCLLRPNSGSIKFEGVEVTKLSGKQLRDYRRNVQIIYQDPFESLNPRQDVLTTISIPIRSLVDERDKQVIYDRVCRLLEEVNLIPGEVLYRYPHQLSGGQRQRVNIARALASNPKLLVADEPITMLDAAQRLNILSLLYDLKLRRKLTVLMITHDLASAKLVSQKTMVMYLGKIVEYGETEAMLSGPLHPYVELLIKASPTPEAQTFSYDEYTALTIEESVDLATGCVFRPRCKYKQQKCEKVVPPLEQKEEGHFAACHYPLNKTRKDTNLPISG